ncbi:dihydrolipoamide acetyltransferase family protein [Promicromonospora sp. MEB111]|uniref:dihydrolipoamide acetyltransferase family protein n=1 Tax=Promicromonospora sp. MEB111 TaxID=3040301 RepID=UPI00254A7B61|nr:dihydrolipoamide acetyltransferase family protein [Promicromonospora sp. MEB111]
MTSTTTEQTFLLPDLGEGLTEAEVVQWLVAEGDVVTMDQPVVEVETAKSVVEVPCPYAGRVGVLHAAEGECVEVGRPLITISADLEPEPDPDPEPDPQPDPQAEAYRTEEQAGSGNVLVGYGTSAHPGAGRRRRPRGTRPAALAVPAVVAAPADDGVANPEPPHDSSPVRVISPIVRRLAREAGLDLAAIPPTGAGGTVTRSDVRAAVERARAASAPSPAAAVAPAAPGEHRIPLSGFRRAASRVLSRSRAEIPEATVWVDVDATALWELREATRTPDDPGPGLLAHIARFVVAGLEAYPVLNARLDTERDEIVVSDAVNLGIAVQGETGLVAPAVLGADSMTTRELDTALRDLTARARVGRSTPGELSGGTFTLNNYGSLGVDGSAAIINHPQVAILGFGRIIDRPWVVDGQIVPRKITQMSFVFDHRVCDGGTAAAFMRTVADAIENPLPAIVRL